MTDIFQEVEEDIRRERMKSLWDRFGWVIILVAVLIVAVTAGYNGYTYFKTRAEQAAGDEFLAALDMAADGRNAAAAEALTEFADGAPGGYPVLARFRAASEQALAGNTEAAVSGFDALANDASLSNRQRDLARVRAGYVLLNGGDRTAVADRVTPVASTAGPWQNTAREILGLAAYQARDYDAAQKWFDEIDADAATTQDLRGRVQLMKELIASERATPAAADANDVSNAGAPADETASAGAEGEVSE
ncbi:tetratricopeptide repeat protein [Amorphus orientalis]|uniref:Ancillary SecYEG translocon subunit/Cell division coordinator CpoB TPR domain-containing protein n=1 Tax=Amorphus orientalis TaxID=649198 RepID=A0AAE3VPF3_9HYPH|nr:tetratricopeptide repeat protein [Amorphus orientalis]MDQ0315603.1 hypothetical protein [Amorphus orientalis]